MITYGINLDPRHDLNILDFTDSGTHPWVRFVLKWDDDVSTIQTFIHRAHYFGCKVLAVIARESYKPTPNQQMWSHYTAARWYSTRYLPYVDMWQLGNEPDIKSASSWTMTPHQYIHMLSYWRKYIPTDRIIGPGLASGSNTWWLKLPSWTRQQLHATAIHMYQQRPSSDYPASDWGHGSVPDLLSLFPDQRIWVTEFGAHVPNDFDTDHQRAQYISKMKEALNGNVDTAFYFCAADSMVEGYGLFDANGNTNETYAAYYN